MSERVDPRTAQPPRSEAQSFSDMDVARTERDSLGEEVPLSAGQQDLLLLQDLYGYSSAFHVCGFVSIEGPLDVACLERSAKSVATGTDALRLFFRKRGGFWTQYLGRTDDRLLKLHGLAKSEQPQQDFDAFLEAFSNPLFDLEKPGLWRMALTRSAPQEQRLVFCAHHLVVDGFGVFALLERLAAAYESELGVGRRALCALDFKDCMLREQALRAGRTERIDSQYFLKQIKSDPVSLTWLTDRPDWIAPLRMGRVTQRVSTSFIGALQSLSRELKVAPADVFTAAVALYRYRISGEERFNLGLHRANRDLDSLHTVGCFSLRSLICPEFSRTMSGAEAIREIASARRRAASQPNLSELSGEIGINRANGEQPYDFEASYCAGHFFGRLGAAAAHFHPTAFGPSLALMFLLVQTSKDGAAALEAHYNENLFDAGTAKGHLDRVFILLGALLRQPTCNIHDLPLMRVAERHKLFSELDDRSVEYASDAALRRTPRQQPPEQVVPESFLRLTRRPLTPSGEVDRKAPRSAPTPPLPSAHDIAQDIHLPEDLVPIPGDLPTTIAGSTGVLLTGATGFLGRYLANELFVRGCPRVVCLVRAADERRATVRLRNAFSEAGLNEAAAAVGSRILALAGNIVKPRLGLDEARYQELARQVDTVLHNAASVSFVKSYDDLKPANVESIRTLFALCAVGRNKAFHFVSTVDVFGPEDYAGVAVTEATLPRKPSPHRRGYAQSKWVAERIADLAKIRGFSVTIYRPSLVVGDSASGFYATKDMGKAFLQLAHDLRAIPDDNRISAWVVPVDQAARRIIAFIDDPACRGQIHHISDWPEVSIRDIRRISLRADIPLALEPITTWKARAGTLTARQPGHPSAWLLPLLSALPWTEGSAATNLRNPVFASFAPPLLPKGFSKTTVEETHRALLAVLRWIHHRSLDIACRQQTRDGVPVQNGS